jgi:lipopolysaccharide/colanic/teichoic acid biosynthesis glycosyltransferase
VLGSALEHQAVAFRLARNTFGTQSFVRRINCTELPASGSAAVPPDIRQAACQRSRRPHSTLPSHLGDGETFCIFSRECTMIASQLISRLRRRWTASSKLREYGLNAEEFEASLRRERAIALRTGRQFSVVTVDPSGPQPVPTFEIQRLIGAQLRDSDIFGRLGNGQIAVLLPETPRAGLTLVANRIGDAVNGAGVNADIQLFTFPDVLESGDTTSTAQPISRSALDGSDDSRVGLVRHRGRAGDEVSIDPLHGSPLGTARSTSEPFRTGSLALTVNGPTPKRVTRLHLSGQHSNDSGAGRLGAGPRPDMEQINRLFLHRPGLLRRAVDIAVSGLALIVLSPLLLLVAIAIKATSRGPILFVQQRAGLAGVPFLFYKFRSMTADADSQKESLRAENEHEGPIFKIKDDPRVTTVGRWLRQWSIDELPQFLNVLLGDMSLVGPRPPTLDEVEQYEPWQYQRLSIVGGLTCIWQVSGRSDVKFVDWVRMDIDYIRRRSIALDSWLLLKTFHAVFARKGAY